MTIMNNRLAALTFGLAVVAAASPSFAQPNHESPDHVSAARAQALRECTAQENKFSEYTYGIGEASIYRACMAQHGQPE